jgi:hypothetical protein
MIILCVLGILAALIDLLCLLPVGAKATYDSGGPRAAAYVGPISVLLYPRPKVKKKPKKQKSKTKTHDKPKETQTSPAPKQEKGGNLAFFRQLLGLALEAQADLRCRLRIRELTLHLTVGGQGDDPAKAATLYGSAWAAIGGVMPLLERAFRIENRDVQAAVDFLSPENTIYFQAECRLRVGTILRMAAWYGLRGLKMYRKKGGTKNGTSNQ